MYRDEELKKIQEIEIDILKKVHDCCEKNDIEYFITGGTALGAVRHKGFIPWDDDIDIGMTRENYNKFKALPSDILGDDYVIACKEREPNTPFPYIKVRYNKSRFVEYVNRNLSGVSEGIYIDVFPYDNMSGDNKKYLKQHKKIRKLAVLYVYSKRSGIKENVTGGQEYIKSFFKFIIYNLLRLLPRNILGQMLDKAMTKYNQEKSERYTCYFFPKPFIEYINNEDLYPLKMYKFENLQVYGPANMDSYLTNHYGDYMKLPPEDERVGHAPFIVELP